MQQEQSMSNELSDANFPRDGEGRVYHLAVKDGEVNNRVLSVGSAQRAAAISALLDPSPVPFVKESSRGFVVYSGCRRGVPVSVIATGMGVPMIDFVVRETAAITKGPMAFVRYGTCGTVKEDIAVGSVCIAELGSVFIRRNPDAFAEGASEDPYVVSKPVAADKELSALVHERLAAKIGEARVVAGLNATADSFYSSQGRTGAVFDDRNEGLVDSLVESLPTLATLEMETFHLLDLARCSRGKIRASAATIVLAQRKSNAWLTKEELHSLEVNGGEAILDALVDMPLDVDSH